MPKLTDEQRKKWEDYQKHSTEFWEKLEAKYHKSEKRHAECRLCGDMVCTTGDIFDALHEHEKSHPEYTEWQALGKEFPISCTSNICVAELPESERGKPMICDMCELYQNRGHVEHRLPGE